MDLEEVKLCPVCKNQLLIDTSNNKYQLFICKNHIKGSWVKLPTSDNDNNIIYESVIELHNNYKLDLRYSENKKNKYIKINIYDKSHKYENNVINNLIPKDFFTNFSINKTYTYCQKILNNLSFM